jgi:hypothetical protein
MDSHIKQNNFSKKISGNLRQISAKNQLEILPRRLTQMDSQIMQNNTFSKKNQRKLAGKNQQKSTRNIAPQINANRFADNAE